MLCKNYCNIGYKTNSVIWDEVIVFVFNFITPRPDKYLIPQFCHDAKTNLNGSYLLHLLMKIRRVSSRAPLFPSFSFKGTFFFLARFGTETTFLSGLWNSLGWRTYHQVYTNFKPQTDLITHPLVPFIE